MCESEIIDLKKEEEYISQYVHLRNIYLDLLLTSPVSVEETKKWLKETDVEIRGIIKNETLCGVVILYLNKQGEVTFFVSEPNKGFGSRLLRIVDKVAIEKGLNEVWAWVLDDNHIAQRTFEKNGYVQQEVTTKMHHDKEYKGIVYKKYLN